MSTNSHKAQQDPERAPESPKSAIEGYLRGALRYDSQLQIKARSIAEDLGLNSSQVGTTLAHWMDDGPEGLAIDSWGDTSTGRDTLWVISR